MGVATGCGCKEVYRSPPTTVAVKKTFPKLVNRSQFE